MKNLLLLLLLICLSCGSKEKQTASNKPLKQLIEVTKTNKPISIDGIANETAWKNAKWHSIDQLWLGDQYSSDDFQGRYKVTWDNDALYVLSEITDDVLLDIENDPLKNYWEDDCLEIFIDENNSGGIHQYSHNAFAYHMALDGNVVDIAPDQEARLYNSHVELKRVTTGNKSVWEVKISIFDDSYKDGEQNKPVKLSADKNMGFAMAYCDNDTSQARESFIGSIPIEGEDKNRGWIDASIFGTLKLVNANN